MFAQGMVDRSSAPVEFLLPIRMASRPVLVLPEWVIDIAIVQQQPDFLAEALPNSIVDTVARIELHQG